ncbi:DUF6081 family protein [Rheinheimera pleomorphica]|uniref:DUF6081 family protein n=1 Tax=Rheinheimera pleomorphica TaxID=2703963 RepID=UPI00141FA717|nr:DUF6081 family protein [Rheinheimera pleomorphica]
MKRVLPVSSKIWAAVCCIASLALSSTYVFAELSGNYVLKYEAQNLTEYQQKWANIYGPLSLSAGGSLAVSKQAVTVSAIPFQVGADFSVFDHLKYIAISTQQFHVPEHGSLEFSAEIIAHTPGTDPGRLIRGCYGPALSYLNLSDPCDQPYQASVLEGQQAGVVLNMINFETGQLFDWFISENKAFALIERLPTVVTGSPGTGLDLAYTQIIREVDINPGKKQHVAIRYSRGPDASFVEFFLNGELFARVDNVGIPLDKQGVSYTGYAPSTGEGELLKERLNTFVIGHGLFSLLDAYPYQHPEAPELSVSIPISERLFGQGAVGQWSKFKVVQKVH